MTKQKMQWDGGMSTRPGSHGRDGGERSELGLVRGGGKPQDAVK